MNKIKYDRINNLIVIEMLKKYVLSLLALGLILWSCSKNNEEAILSQKIDKYFLA